MRALVWLLLILAGPVLAQDDWEDDWGDDWDSEETGSSAWNWTGFVEFGLGDRFHGGSALSDQRTLEEIRWRIQTERSFGAVRWSLKGDLDHDAVTDGWGGDLREFALHFSPGERSDLNVGRQVLTWGTGDFVFLNDLFPKDFEAFFSGRDDEYLKAASDTVRWSWYGERINLDLAWSPEFEPDRYLTGERFTFFLPQTGERGAPQPPLKVQGPDDGELAARAYRTVDGTEYALYGYSGRFKSPRGIDIDGRPYYPELNVWGASLRRPLGPGLINAEVAWYDSREDADGDHPGVPNSQFRALVGWEQELVRNLTLGVQGYLEHTRDHAALLAHSPMPEWEPARNRTVFTSRLTYRWAQDRFTAVLFAFVSPSDDDHHLRPRLDYRRDDRWLFSAGMNLFGGRRAETFFDQLDGNDNVYLRIRFHY